MSDWQPSDAAWSFSRKSMFENCKREYFYYRFWGQNAKSKWTIFEMRRITTLAMLKGLVVHKVIVEALKRARFDSKLSLEEAKELATHIIRTKYMESKLKLWHISNRPYGKKVSDFTNLFEHYYSHNGVDERAKQARISAWESIENLWKSDLWKEIIESSPSQWATVDSEEFPSFDLDGIKVYSTIDFAHTIDKPTIIDWKTGSDSSADISQLVLYSLYAQQEWGWNPAETKLKLVYMSPEMNIIETIPTPEKIEEMKNIVRASFAKMMELEPAFGEADINNFPSTQNHQSCKWCKFQGICEGAKQG